MKTCRKMMAVIVVAAMVLSGMADIGTVKTAKAAKALKLSKTSVKMAVGKRKEVKIKHFNAKKVKKVVIKNSDPEVASAKKKGKNAIKVKGKMAGTTTVKVRIRLKNVKKATVLTLKVTVRDNAGTDIQPSVTPGGNPQQTTPPTGGTGTTPAGGTNTTPPTGTSSSGGTGTSPSQNPSGTIDMTNSGLYDEDGTLKKSWSALLEDGDIVVVDDEITDCDSGLTGVLKIPSYVTSIGGAFYRCRGLTGITIPSGVTSIGDYAFWDCSSLAEISIPSGVTSIGYNAFY